MDTRDRAIGALVGLAVGDAVGTTLEFKRPGTFTPITDMVGGGPFGLDVGQWTDDTSMAMCLAESILDLGGNDPADQLRRYLAWRHEGYWSSNGRCFDIGNTVSAALARFERDGSVTDTFIAEEAAANGSLMRLAPVAIRWFDDPAEAAEQAAVSSRTTHPASRPVDACRAYAAMTAALIAGRSIASVLDAGFWDLGPLDPRIETVVRGSWRHKEPPAIRGTGYVVDALEAALWAVAGAEDFRDAILRAANLGNDADTTAAIAGQLAGARWGVSGIPARWTDAITYGPRIIAIAGRLHDQVIGQAPPERWGHDAEVHGYWVEPGRLLAGEYPGDLDPARAVEKIELLVDHGVRTFVDLTNDPHLRPYGDDLALVAAQRGLALERIHEPVPDMGVVDTDDYVRIVAVIEAAAGRGAVYVHCWGGIGRTATVVGCVLVDRGSGVDDALARIAGMRASTRKAHMQAPQTADQRKAIRDYEKKSTQ